MKSQANTKLKRWCMGNLSFLRGQKEDYIVQASPHPDVP